MRRIVNSTIPAFSRDEESTDMRILYLKNDCSTDRSTQFLKMSEYEIVEAASYDDALSLLKTYCFDVLLIAHGASP